MPTVALPLPRYTVDDLDRLPDDGNRYELLEGWLIVSPFPGLRHQELVTELVAALRAYVGRGVLGHVYAGGVVERVRDTRLIPDVLVTSPRARGTSSWSDPHDRWLAVEVLSPSTERYDRSYKVNAYLALGVREAWLVDPRARAIEVHRAVGATPDLVVDVLRWQAPGTDAPFVLDVRALFADVASDAD